MDFIAFSILIIGALIGIIYFIQPRVLYVVTVSIQNLDDSIVYQAAYVFTTPEQAVKQRDKLMKQLSSSQSVTVTLSRDVILNREAVV